ncbi:MAG: hypothetical protein FJ087_20190 [Deltaproteobacteria bacterium]|nr:hypothetical protein [Deltaproteobacteria bacterium]
MRRRLRVAGALAAWLGAAAAAGLATWIAVTKTGGAWEVALPLAPIALLLGAAYALQRPDPVRLLLDADRRLATDDALAGAWCALPRDGEMAEAAVDRGASFAARAERLWPAGPRVIPPAVALAAAWIAIPIALTRVPPPPAPVPAATAPQARGAQPSAAAADARATPPRKLPPERAAAAKARHQVAKAAAAMADPKTRDEAMKLAEALEKFSEGRAEAPEVMAAAERFSKQAEEVAKEAAKPEVLKEIPPSLVKALANDPLMRAIAKALARKDFKVGADLLKDLLSHLSPEEARRLAEEFKDFGGGSAGSGPSLAGEPSKGSEPGKGQEHSTAETAERSGPGGGREQGNPNGKESRGPGEDGKEAAAKVPGPGEAPKAEGAAKVGDAIRAAEASKAGQDAAEEARRAAGKAERGEQAAAARGEGATARGEDAAGQATDRDGNGTAERKAGGGEGERTAEDRAPGGAGAEGMQAGTGAAGSPAGAAERIEVGLRDETLPGASGGAKALSVREAVVRGSAEGAAVPGFKEVVDRYRAVSPEDVARAGLPAPLRAMVEAYFDRISGRPPR